MKKREIEHWTRNEYLRGMLLFAQALEEETFNYSYESYKVPALNKSFPICRTISYYIEAYTLINRSFEFHFMKTV